MTKTESNEWLSLKQAADILGVHPATVRNWADDGKLPFRRTPGKHRRFRRDDLLHYAQSQGELQPLEVQVIIQNALGSARMHVGEGDLSEMRWYKDMSDDGRQYMRKQGRRVLDALRAYLGAGAPDEMLSEAIAIGKDYAKALSEDEMTLPQAMRGFFYFSDFVVDSILTWSELSPPRNSSEWSTLLKQVNAFIHTMLLSIAEYYEED
ncbi:helix-turn-helix domain-containing protein [Phototrophicus methaneseepsis]|uniref:Helix-turn-helix domain-containing protein n=1 Tax=Phototrophicus methaneseepsis TaxID=2710758 RepID=A0A7S8E9A0_9CHLR|nr:helix-turn-helix domain-containing protein [Phototrophicus methaneseepsis]QPC82628.1 helix-turn-helix domain-containing protein [Phototrophicus methaneseepsis]